MNFIELIRILKEDKSVSGILKDKVVFVDSELNLSVHSQTIFSGTSCPSDTAMPILNAGDILSNDWELKDMGNGRYTKIRPWRTIAKFTNFKLIEYLDRE